MNALTHRLSGWFGRTPRDPVALPIRGRGYERSATAVPAPVQGFDQALLWVTVGLLAFGLVMVYSASVALPDNHDRVIGNKKFVLERQGLCYLLLASGVAGQGRQADVAASGIECEVSGRTPTPCVTMFSCTSPRPGEPR